MGKMKKKIAEKIFHKKAANSKKSLNPFEVHINKQKYEVLGQKLKNDRGLPGVSRAKAIQKRKHTLLPEYNVKNKSNKFVDRRIGERNFSMTEEDRTMARYTAEKMRHHNRKSIYNLADDEILTHRGQTLSEIEKFDDPRSDDDDEDDDGKNKSGKLEDSFVGDAHFGGGVLTRTGKDGAKSHKDLIDQLIAESKKRKAEKQKTKEETLELTEKLDSDWKDLLPLVSKSKKDNTEPEVYQKPDDYDKVMRELKFEARGNPSDRLKSEDEIAKEEKERLEKLEQDRLNRMMGIVEKPSDKRQHRSADDLDDNFNYDSDPEDALAYDEEGKLRNNPQENEANKDEEDEEPEQEENENGEEGESSEAETDDDLSDLKKSESDSDLEIEETTKSKNKQKEAKENNQKQVKEIKQKEVKIIKQKDQKENVEEEESSEAETDDNVKESESGSDGDIEIEETIKNKNKHKEAKENKQKEITETKQKEQEEIKQKEPNENKQNEDNIDRKRKLSEPDVSNTKIQKTEWIYPRLLPVRVEKVETELKPEELNEMIEKAKKELPFTYKIPESYEALQSLLSSQPPEYQNVIIERMIKCNHPSLAEENKDNLSKLFIYIMQHLNDIAPDNNVDSVDSIKYCFAVLNSLTPHLYTLTQLNPLNTLNSLIEVIKEKQNDYRKKLKQYPGIDVLVFLKLISCLFSTSDFRHQVVTPAFVFISQMLTNCKIKTRYDVNYGLFLVTLFLEYTTLSKRYLPAVITYLTGIIHMHVPKIGVRVIKIHPPFKANSTLLVLPEKCKITSDLIMTAEDFVSTEFDSEFKVKVLHTTLKFCEELEKNWANLPSSLNIFNPFYELLEKVPKTNYPKHIQNQIEEMIDKNLETKKNKKIERIMLDKKKPKALRLYEPNIQPVFEFRKTKPMSRERAEREKLMHKYKKEMKGAVREIRRDKSFLGRVKIRQQVESDYERREKVKRIYAEASMQQSELNAFDRQKKTK